MASSAEHRAVVERYYTEVLNEKDLDALSELLAPDTDGIDCAGAEHVGLEGARAFLGGLISGFPNLYAQVLSYIADGHQVATHWVANAINSGELFGMPATNKVVPLQFFELFTFEGGLIKSVLSHPDSAAILSTLDADFSTPIARAIGFGGVPAAAG